jgi:hypothetical protein
MNWASAMANVSTKTSLPLLLGSLLLASIADAQQQSPLPLTVRFDSANTSVVIAEPSDLRIVLDEVCRQTKTSCEGTQYLAGSKVAPMQLQGSWNSVIDQLLEGSGVNYVASPPSEVGSGRLIIQAKGTNGPDSGFTQNGAERPGDTRPDLSGAKTLPDRTIAVEDSLQSGTEVSQSAPAGSPAARSSSLAGSPLTSDLPAVANSEPAAYLPFPDSHGNPIPTTNAPVLYLPFPDSHGNPIPVDPNAPTGSPFPIEAIRHANGH